MVRLRMAARLVLPALWLGLIVGISLIEAPLKFQAPGITIALGLGIGRLVFTAMNIVELVLAALLVLSLVGAARRPSVLGAGGRRRRRAAGQSAGDPAAAQPPDRHGAGWHR
jgi:hypothetical protein